MGKKFKATDDMVALVLWKALGVFLAGIILFFHGSSNSEKAPGYTFVKEATWAPATPTYHDYIVVGGGTAGCPLAATLSEGGAAVLVLERGGSPYGNADIANIRNFVPLLSDTSPGSPTQQFVSEDGVFNHRARVLGGGSALNAGFFTRAEEEIVAAAGWDREAVESAYVWAERVVAFEPEVGGWQAAVRDGLVEAGVLPYNGFTYDHLYGTKIGGSIFDKEGHRHTAADLLQYADPTKITVYLHATVHKILFRSKPGRSKPEAYGVIYKDAKGVMHRAYLNHHPKSEIILSAGALGSPQLLMLSGIGPAHHLKAHDIDIVLDQPMVGQGMADNPMNVLFIPSPIPVEVSLIQVVGITKFGSYIEAASGMSIIRSWATRFTQHHDQSLNQTDKPLTSTSSDDEAKSKAYYEAMNLANNTTIRGGIILEKINGPRSSGHLELRNTNPAHNPAVTFNYFTEEEDLRKCVQGMETIIEVVNSMAFSKYRYSDATVQTLINWVAGFPTNLRPRHLTTALSLEQFCIDTVVTIWHYHGGCQVGRVVDRDYKVLGVDALRVVDGSTFLNSPGTNPQATVMMLGRYVGSKILHER